MFCRKCGKEIMDEAVICIHCGCSTKDTTATGVDAPNIGITVLCALFPIVGLILWLCYKDTKPLFAKSAGKGGLIGLGVSLAFILIAAAVGF